MIPQAKITDIMLNTRDAIVLKNLDSQLLTLFCTSKYVCSLCFKTLPTLQWFETNAKNNYSRCNKNDSRASIPYTEQGVGYFHS